VRLDLILFLILIGWLRSLCASGQDHDERSIDLTIKEKERAIVRIARREDPRPIIIEYNQEWLPNINARSSSSLFGNAETDLENIRRRKIQIKFPIVIRDKVQIIGDFIYKREKFEFENITTGNYQFYDSLRGRSLTIVGGTGIVRIKLTKDRFMFGFVRLTLNSDDIEFDFDQMKTSTGLIYGWNKKEGDLKYGFGGSIGLDFGIPQFFPLLIYNRRFNERWGLEVLLPKRVKVRYTVNSKLHFYSFIELTGATYRLRKEFLQGFDRVDLTRTAARLNLSVEREIYDFFWVRFRTGYAFPISFFVAEPRDRQKDAIIKIETDPAPYIQVALLAVVPRKMWKRAKSRGGGEIKAEKRRRAF